MAKGFVRREPNPRRRERKQTITDAFLSNVGVPGLGGLLFGMTAAVLILASNRVELPTASNAFFWAVIVLLAILFFVRLFKERGLDQLNQWGVISLSLLGFGVGTLIYLLREWGIWLWMEFRGGASWLWIEFRKIDEPHEWLLTSLVLLGVILGFFVVRNWSKEQGDFVKSLTAVFGGAFVTTLLGEAADVGKVTAFAYYAIGFTASGVLNLVASSWLIASYSEKKSIASRSVLTFLYGADKAEAVDKQFLRNFEEDPNYARRLLIKTVLEFEKKVLLEFANKREQKRRKQDPASPLRYYQLIAIECEKPAVPALAPVPGQPAAPDPGQPPAPDPGQPPAPDPAQPPAPVPGQPPAPVPGQPPAPVPGQPPTPVPGQPPAPVPGQPPAPVPGQPPAPVPGQPPAPVPGQPPAPVPGQPPAPVPGQPPAPVPGQPPGANQGQPVPPAAANAQDAQISATTQMKVVFREIPKDEPLSEKMFRGAVSLKWQDNLEFIDAAAAYKQSFPYFGSVAGLALEVLQTIVMDRDKYKRFRTTQYPQGLCPANIEQARGLDEIDYLSYIAVPVASYPGQPEQTRLGVLHVDTKLFVAPPQELNFNNNNGVLTAKLRPADLTEYANNVYDQDPDDLGVKYLEDMRAVLVPLLQLYLKCRQGSA